MLSSSISRLLIGPLVSVIFPAPASIFLTTPLTVASWADAANEAKMESAADAGVSLLNFIFFPFSGFNFGALLEEYCSEHPGFSVPGDQKRIFELAGLTEFP